MNGITEAQLNIIQLNAIDLRVDDQYGKALVRRIEVNLANDSTIFPNSGEFV